MKAIIVLFVFLIAVLANEQIPNFEHNAKHKNLGLFPFDNPLVKDGLPLPMPKLWTTSDIVFSIRSDGFIFNATGNTCDDLEAAFDRYHQMIFYVPTNKGSRNTAVSGMSHSCI